MKHHLLPLFQTKEKEPHVEFEDYKKEVKISNNIDLKDDGSCWLNGKRVWNSTYEEKARALLHKIEKDKEKFFARFRFNDLKVGDKIYFSDSTLSQLPLHIQSEYQRETPDNAIAYYVWSISGKYDNHRADITYFLDHKHSNTYFSIEAECFFQPHDNEAVVDAFEIKMHSPELDDEPIFILLKDFEALCDHDGCFVIRKIDEERTNVPRRTDTGEVLS